MRKALLFTLALIYSHLSTADTIYEYFDSEILNQTRSIKIKLPEDYDGESIENYPLIIALDGDYLFEPISGHIHYQSYFDDMPKAIVVGIMHEGNRFSDTFFDEATGMPIDTGFRFAQFISDELVPYLDKKYNTSSFKVAVGHNKSATVVNSFLFEEMPIFKAYINLSPDLPDGMINSITERLQWAEENILYYLSTSQRDIRGLKASIFDAKEKITSVDNERVNFFFDEFDNANHYQYVPGAIAKAFDQIFKFYRPVSDAELAETSLDYVGELDKFLVDRYQKIENIYGLYRTIPEEEFEKLMAIAEKEEDLKSIERLGKLAKKEMPNNNLGTYYLAVHAEKSGKTKRASKLYADALSMDESIQINKDIILTKVEDLKMASGGDDDEDDD